MDEHMMRAILESLADHYESLKAQVAASEERIKDLECRYECSCQTWREHTGAPRELVRGLDESFVDMHQNDTGTA